MLFSSIYELVEYIIGSLPDKWPIHHELPIDTACRVGTRAGARGELGARQGGAVSGENQGREVVSHEARPSGRPGGRRRRTGAVGDREEGAEGGRRRERETGAFP